MIVMRVDNVSGSCQLAGYDKSKECWFPVDSVSFGFDNADSNSFSTEDLETDTAEGEASQLSISKAIDSATCDLMMMAMQARLQSKTKEKKTLAADIHFVETAQGGRPVAYLRVALANVQIQSWSLSGSNDGRPTEDVTLRFDKAAVQYQATSDGKTFAPAGKKGWDQVNNKAWLPKTSYFP